MGPETTVINRILVVLKNVSLNEFLRGKIEGLAVVLLSSSMTAQ